MDIPEAERRATYVHWKMVIKKANMPRDTVYKSMMRQNHLFFLDGKIP